MTEKIEDIIETVKFPHELFALCLKISKGQKSTKTFVTKNEKYSTTVMCFPKQHRIAVVIAKPGEFTSEIEEDINLYYDDLHCEYSIRRQHKSLVAKSISTLVNEHENKEKPPYRDWITWILDGTYNTLKDSTRINPYTGEQLPYFEDTEHDRYMGAMIGEMDKTDEWLGKALAEAKGQPKIYHIFPPDPEEIKKRVKDSTE